MTTTYDHARFVILADKSARKTITNEERAELIDLFAAKQEQDRELANGLANSGIVVASNDTLDAVARLYDDLEYQLVGVGLWRASRCKSITDKYNSLAKDAKLPQVNSPEELYTMRHTGAIASAVARGKAQGRARWESAWAKTINKNMSLAQQTAIIPSKPTTKTN